MKINNNNNNTKSNKQGSKLKRTIKESNFKKSEFTTDDENQLRLVCIVLEGLLRRLWQATFEGSLLFSHPFSSALSYFSYFLSSLPFLPVFFFSFSFFQQRSFHSQTSTKAISSFLNSTKSFFLFLFLSSNSLLTLQHHHYSDIEIKTPVSMPYFNFQSPLSHHSFRYVEQFYCEGSFLSFVLSFSPSPLSSSPFLTLTTLSGL